MVTMPPPLHLLPVSGRGAHAAPAAPAEHADEGGAEQDAESGRHRRRRRRRLSALGQLAAVLGAAGLGLAAALLVLQHRASAARSEADVLRGSLEAAELRLREAAERLSVERAEGRQLLSELHQRRREDSVAHGMLEGRLGARRDERSKRERDAAARRCEAEEGLVEDIEEGLDSCETALGDLGRRIASLQDALQHFDDMQVPIRGVPGGATLPPEAEIFSWDQF
eukprot:TRINITY_DN3025_c3_g1_i1.p2 TRINITY_DN3025_c3_g1~~TRINITY_DN3025_c3_g1_i1.p2  ORF type:complete len:248 (+),score=100.56 TRINITY_DN3025_c3_g1_i1:70-744(+)